MVHKARAVPLQCCIYDLKRHKKKSRYSSKTPVTRSHTTIDYKRMLLLVTKKCQTHTHLIILQSHEVVVYVLVSGILFHSRLELLVVQHLTAVLQHKSVPDKTYTLDLKDWCVCRFDQTPLASIYCFKINFLDQIFHRCKHACSLTEAGPWLPAVPSLYLQSE